MKLQSELMQTSSSYDGGHCRSDGAAAVVCRDSCVKFRNESILRLKRDYLPGSEEIEWEKCKKELSKKLVEKCIVLGILEVVV